MSNLPTKYQPQLPARADRQGSRELARTQRDLAHITAVAHAGHQAIGDIYTAEVSIVARDLEYMNDQVCRAIANGMPPGQAEALYTETVHYQQYMSAVSDNAAAHILDVQHERSRLPEPSLVDRLLGG